MCTGIENRLLRRRINVGMNNGSGGGGSKFPYDAGANGLKEEVDIDDHNFHPTMSYENVSIHPGVRMMLADHVRGRRVHIEYEIDQAPVSFSYTLTERIHCTMRRGLRYRKKAQRLPGDGVIAFLPGTTGTIDIFPNRRIVGVSLHFSPSAFKKLFPSLPSLLKPLNSDFSELSAIKPFYLQTRFGMETFQVLQQILQCPYTGEIRRLYFEAKALELAALKLAELGQTEKKEDEKPGRRDIDRIQEAYHILLARLDHPPSLIDLSRMVGLNRNKLNHGFKTLFGDTAFNLLHKARLSKARSLIRNSDLSLSEIALSVGYNNQSNFTNAFRKYYGKTPKTVRGEDYCDSPDPAVLVDFLR